VEWNRLASQATPGKQADTNIEFCQRPISQERQHHTVSSLRPSSTIAQSDIEQQLLMMTKLQLQQYCQYKHIDISGLSHIKILIKSVQHTTHGTPETKLSSQACVTQRTDSRRWWPVHTGSYVAATEENLLARDRLQALQFSSSIGQHVLAPGMFNDQKLWQEVWQYLMIAERGESAPSDAAKF
jgi:hypothetical protein